MEEERNSAGISANRNGRRWNRRNSRLGLRSDFGIHVRPKHDTWSDHDSWNHGAGINHYTRHNSAWHCITDAGHSNAGSRDGQSDPRHSNSGARNDSGDYSDGSDS